MVCVLELRMATWDLDPCWLGAETLVEGGWETRLTTTTDRMASGLETRRPTESRQEFQVEI